MATAIAIAMVICSHGGESGIWAVGMGVLATLRDFTHDFKLMTEAALCTHSTHPSLVHL